MTAPMPAFTSEEDFNQYSFNLSKQLKSIKLNALRSAMAKASGFSHLDAYLEHLNKTSTGQTSTGQTSESRDDRDRVLMALDRNVFVRKQHHDLVFQCPASIKPASSEIHTAPWRALASQQMTGDPMLLDAVKVINIKGKPYLHGTVEGQKLARMAPYFLIQALGHFQGKHMFECPEHWVFDKLFQRMFKALTDDQDPARALIQDWLQSHCWGADIRNDVSTREARGETLFDYDRALMDLALVAYCPANLKLRVDDLANADYRNTTKAVRADKAVTEEMNDRMAAMLAASFNLMIRAEGKTQDAPLSQAELDLAKAARQNKAEMFRVASLAYFTDRVVERTYES